MIKPNIIFEHYLENAKFTKPFKFALVQETDVQRFSFYIENFDILNRPFYQIIDDYDNDYNMSIRFYLYENYKLPKIPQEIFDLMNVKWASRYHLDELIIQSLNDDKLVFSNKTKDSFLLLKNLIQENISKHPNREDFKKILEEINKRIKEFKEKSI